DCIRDRNVTGVQTCALPIYKSIIHMRLILQKFISPANWFGLSYSDVVEERVPLVLCKVSLNRLRLVRKDRSALKDIQIDGEIDEIGRASCRERVKIERVEAA